MKTCNKCGETKELSEFHKNKSSKDGLTYRCKECTREYNNKYWQKNKETKNKQARERRKIDSSRELNSQKRYRDRLRNRTDEELRAAQDAKPFKRCTKCGLTLTSRENFSELRSRPDGFHSECKLCASQRSSKWQKENPDKSKEYIKKYQKRNPEKMKSIKERRRIRKRGTLTEWDLRLSAQWRKVISKMPCYYCGTDDPWIVYHVDHRIPVSKGGDDSWINLVRACEPCNLSKSAKTDAEFFGWNE